MIVGNRNDGSIPIRATDCSRSLRTKAVADSHLKPFSGREKRASLFVGGIHGGAIIGTPAKPCKEEQPFLLVAPVALLSPRSLLELRGRTLEGGCRSLLLFTFEFIALSCEGEH
jgi:hypothetical protein